MNALPPKADLGGHDSSTHVAEIGQAVHVGLLGLQQRIDELHRSVDTLATEGRWVDPEPDLTYAPPVTTPYSQPFLEPPLPYEYGYQYEQPAHYESYATAPEMHGWIPPPRPEPAYPPPSALLPPPPLAPAEWEQPFEPPFQEAAPVWAAPPPPNPTLIAEPAPQQQPDPWSTIALLDAGPFADLIELRHFEEALATLQAVIDVRVRRFGHGRARIEVAMAGPHSVADELGRTARPMAITSGPVGEVIVELPPMPGPVDNPGDTG